MLYPEFEELISYKNLKWDVTLTSKRQVQSGVLGGHHSPFRGTGLEFDSVRKYVPGDDIRNIDWRVTARTGSPHLKIFQEERQREVFICVDNNAEMRFGTKGTFKSVQAAHIASMLGFQGLSHQDKIHACLFGDIAEKFKFFTPKQSKTAFLQFLKRLCEPNHEHAQVLVSEMFEQISQTAHTGSLVYFISDFMELSRWDVYQSYLSKLSQKCDVIFIAVNDPLDKALVQLGKWSGFSATHEKCVVDTDNIAGCELYARQWQENRETLYQIVSKFGISLLELTTESDLKKELLLSLHNLSKRGRL